LSSLLLKQPKKVFGDEIVLLVHYFCYTRFETPPRLIQEFVSQKLHFFSFSSRKSTRIVLLDVFLGGAAFGRPVGGPSGFHRSWDSPSSPSGSVFLAVVVVPILSSESTIVCESKVWEDLPFFLFRNWQE
jgi:hypothetical protein